MVAQIESRRDDALKFFGEANRQEEYAKLASFEKGVLHERSVVEVAEVAEVATS